MNHKEVEPLIAVLIKKAISSQLIGKMDTIYAYNRILNLFRQDFATLELLSGDDQEPDNMGISLPGCLELLCDSAVERGIIDDLSDIREIFSAQIMDCFQDRPSVVNCRFWEMYREEPAQATDWFYKMSQAVNYIQTERIARNITYKAKSMYGELDITINLAKPEKNPRDIIAARRQKDLSYPRCLLCVENEGYAGRIAYPARASHRLIRLRLDSEPWFFQYSPYSYYPEHCIILSEQHVPMQISRQTFSRLLEFVTIFPHYFAGSNADLPIVGGSILSHDHYQGGRYEFAMNRAGLDHRFELPGYENLGCGVVRWPMSVIRLVSPQRKSIIDAADLITRQWRQYSDEQVRILAASKGEPHNTVTPIAGRRGQDYVLDLVLRNNRVSDEHPLGIFHPHADVHHIKKENIGLIEVMGLAVLPPRLAEELWEVELFLQDRPANVASGHREWAERLKLSYGGKIDGETAADIVREAVAARFERVLADAGVFKRDAAGQAAFRRFIFSLQQLA